MVVDAIVAAAAAYARGGYDVVVDGVIGPWFLPPFRQAAAAEQDARRTSYLAPTWTPPSAAHRTEAPAS